MLMKQKLLSHFWEKLQFNRAFGRITKGRTMKGRITKGRITKDRITKGIITKGRIMIR